MRGRMLLPTLLLGASLLLSGCTLLDPEEGEESVEFPTNATETEDPFDLAEPAPAPTDIAGGDDASPPPMTTTPAPPSPTAPAPGEPTPAAPSAPPAQPSPGSPTAPGPGPTPPPATTTPPPSPPPAQPTPPTQPTQPTQPPPDTSWPREGSHVRYEARASRSSYDGEYSQEDVSTVTWTFTGGDWRGVCTNQKTEHVNGNWQNSTSTRQLDASTPPHWPPMNTRSPPAVGQPVDVWYIDACSPSDWESVFTGSATEQTTRNGQSVTVASYAADMSAENQAFATEWSQSHGLVLKWSHWRSGGAMSSGFSGRLVDTDAPLS